MITRIEKTLVASDDNFCTGRMAKTEWVIEVALGTKSFRLDGEDLKSFNLIEVVLKL